MSDVGRGQWTAPRRHPSLDSCVLFVRPGPVGITASEQLTLPRRRWMKYGRFEKPDLRKKSRKFAAWAEKLSSRSPPSLASTAGCSHVAGPWRAQVGYAG
eukprot:scaffold4907_cov122-Isochrysis_galbana.AAC.9